MFLIRWLLIFNSIIPALILFPIKKIYLRKDKREKHSGPVIISMNHTSFLDYIEALLAFPGRRMFVLVGAKFYAWNPFLTFLLKAMGVIKVDEVTGNMDAVNKAVEQINKGHNILIFPEGHIETEGKLMEYKQAAALISLSSGRMSILHVMISITCRTEQMLLLLICRTRLKNTDSSILETS